MSVPRWGYFRYSPEGTWVIGDNWNFKRGEIPIAKLCGLPNDEENGRLMAASNQLLEALSLMVAESSLSGITLQSMGLNVSSDADSLNLNPGTVAYIKALQAIEIATKAP